MSIRSTCLTFLIFQTFFVKCLSTTCDAKCQQKIMSNSLIDEERLTLIKQEILRKIDLIPSPVPALLNLRRSDTVIQSSKEAQNLMISVKKCKFIDLKIVFRHPLFILKTLLDLKTFFYSPKLK